MSGLQNDPGTVQQEAGFGFTGRFWTETFNDSMTARAGGGRANATKIDSMFCTVSTVASVGDSVVLPPISSFPGGALIICVTNTAANAMLVFADGSDTINGIAGATGVTQMGGSIVYYQMTKAATWVAILGSGFAGNFPTYSTTDGLTAHAGGGQALGTPVTASVALFQTVVTGGDSALLPAAKVGMEITVVNRTAATSMNVFPAVGETINNLAANTQIAVAGATTLIFYCGTTGAWWTK